jgi:NADH-quinone oxidoreductase subunit M
MRILSSLWLLPALGGLITLGVGWGFFKSAKRLALLFSLSVLGLTFYLLSLSGGGGLGLAEVGPQWGYGIRYSLALDGLSLSLCWLNAFLTCMALLSSWRQDLTAGFWASFLFLEAALMGVFLSRDLLFFFVFWEAALIPMFFIIGLWGSEARSSAAMKFFLFTFFGSIILLIGFLSLVTGHREVTGIWTWDMTSLKGPSSGFTGLAIFSAIALGFAVKIPLVPLHTWLPDAHTEAPAAGSVMLAGVLLKMGVYGFLRILMPVFPELSWSLLPWLGLLAAINIIYGALCAMAQSDLKRLVAYSSVAHLGFCLMGILSRTPEGLVGGSLQMINHGLSTGALFMMVGFLYERSHRRGLADFGALTQRAPWLSFFFGVATMASIGLPGLNGFVGEFMSLAGMMRVLPVLAIVGVAGVTLSAAYALPAYQAVFWGEQAPGSVSPSVFDLDFREKTLLWILSLLMLGIGLYPAPWLELIAPSLQGLLQ